VCIYSTVAKAIVNKNFIVNPRGPKWWTGNYLPNEPVIQEPDRLWLVPLTASRLSVPCPVCEEQCRLAVDNSFFRGVWLFYAPMNLPDTDSEEDPWLPREFVKYATYGVACNPTVQEIIDVTQEAMSFSNEHGETLKSII
jgi:hypothetical protein